MNLQPTAPDHIVEWRKTRLEKLTAEDGWLNIVGRQWIGPGTITLGTTEAHDFRLPVGPTELGTFTLNDDDSAVFMPADGSAPVPVAREGKRWPHFRVGRFLMEITALDARRALRIRDTESTARSRITAIPSFAFDPALRIIARWEKLAREMNLTVDNVIGIPTKIPVTHVARFAIAGTEMALLPTYGTPQRPQFVIRDLTSLDDTYARGRFVFGEDVTETTIALDFNKAINPPCAFTPFASCPLPPRENLFPIRLEAGEKRPAATPLAG